MGIKVYFFILLGHTLINSGLKADDIINVSKDVQIEEKDLFKRFEKEKDKYPHLYIPSENFIYKKFKLDSGFYYVNLPVREKASGADSRRVIYPEINFSFEWWHFKNFGLSLSYAAGFLPVESDDLDDFFYYPTTINLSFKYKGAIDYLLSSPYFNIELGLHYHDLNISKRENELVNRVYKGLFIGIEQGVPLNQNLGFFFELNFMPYLISREFDGDSYLKNRSLGFEFLASGYFTTKIKIIKNYLHRLKLYIGFSQRDYFTDVKDLSLGKNMLNQKYTSFFLRTSQDF